MKKCQKIEYVFQILRSTFEKGVFPSDGIGLRE